MLTLPMPHRSHSNVSWVLRHLYFMVHLDTGQVTAAATTACDSYSQASIHMNASLSQACICLQWGGERKPQPDTPGGVLSWERTKVLGVEIQPSQSFIPPTSSVWNRWEAPYTTGQPVPLKLVCLDEISLMCMGAFTLHLRGSSIWENP